VIVEVYYDCGSVIVVVVVIVVTSLVVVWIITE
jgi:hypothetical protein